MNEKTTFFHTIEFNVSLIIAFFQAFVGALVIGTVVAVHSLGAAVGAELSRDERPAPRVETPSGEPLPRPVPGIPVALSSSGDGR